MSKVIKVKQSDIENIVKQVLSEQSFDDFDSKIQPEELPQEPEIDPSEFEDENQGESQVTKIFIGKDENGRIAVVDTQSGDILGIK